MYITFERQVMTIQSTIIKYFVKQDLKSIKTTNSKDIHEKVKHQTK